MKINFDVEIEDHYGETEEIIAHLNRFLAEGPWTKVTWTLDKQP